MKRAFLLAFLLGLSVVCYGQSTKPATSASQPTTQPVQGNLSLEVLPVAEDNEKPSEAFSCIVVFSDKKVLATGYGVFGKRIDIAGLPSGPVTVVVFPWRGKDQSGYFGESNFAVQEKGANVLSLACVKRPAFSCQVDVADAKGKPVVLKAVRLRDVTDCEFPYPAELKTNKDGQLSFYGFAGRKYKAMIVDDDGTNRLIYNSKPMLIGDKDNAFAWQLEEKKRLILKLWVEDGGQKKPLDVGALPLTIGTSSPKSVKNSQCVIYKESIPSGVTELSIDLASYTAFSGLFVKENKTVKIDDTAEQVVDVVFSHILVADVMVTCPQAPQANKDTPAAMYICAGDKVVWHAGLSTAAKVPPGKYTVLVWLPGWKLGAKEVEFKDGKNEVDVELTKAGQTTAVVQDEKGNPVENARVAVTYPKWATLYMTSSNTKTTKNGEFALPSDEGENGVFAVFMPGMARAYADVAKVAKDGKIVITEGMKVTRTVNVGDVPDAKEGMYIWRRKDHRWLDYAASPAANGTVEALLAAGEYSEFLRIRDYYVHVQDFTVKDKEDGAQSVSITVESWAKRLMWKDLK